MDYVDDAVFRDIEGVTPDWTNPNLPNPPIPRDEPIVTRIEGPWGVPWLDGQEDPFEPSGLLAPSKNPQIDEPDVGWSMPPGDYQGAFRTKGPVRAWGHEPSGGLWGDQALGRTMRFPVNVPDRYDANGVWVGDYRDQLAYNVAVNKMPSFTDTDAIEDLVTWEPPKFGGYGAVS